MDIVTRSMYILFPLSPPVNLDESIREEKAMPKRTQNREVTSEKAASAASKVLRDPRSNKAAKSAAASALTQRPNKK